MQSFIPAFVEEQRKAGRSQGSLDAAVLFVDISGFTALTEMAFEMGDAGAEMISVELRRIFDPMVNAVRTRGGFISGFAGDAFTAVFPATEDASARARDAATEIIEFFKEHGTSKRGSQTLTFGVKCGLETGGVEWGIPENDRIAARTWYFRGEAIEGAAAAEKIAGRGELQIGEGARAAIDACGEAGKAKPSRTLSDIDTLRLYFQDSLIERGEASELRHAASVFLNFVGPEDFSSINRVYDALSSLCVRHGGVLNKIDFGDKGFTALVFFGAPLALENVEDAAVGLVRSLRIGEASDIPGLSIRAGIDAGLVYSGILGGSERNEWTCIGDMVNTSARLMAAAEPGETLVSERIKSPTEKTWEFDSLGTRVFKGKTGEQEVYSAGARRGRALGFAYRYPMIGREKELQELLDFVDPIFSENPKFVGIKRLLGEPGVGKTRVVAALRAKLEERGTPLSWIPLPCDGVHRSGWNSVVMWLRDLLRIPETASPELRRESLEARYELFVQDERIPEATRSELQRTISFVGDLVDCHWEGSPFDRLDDAKLRHENRIIAVKELVRALAARGPVVIELEDAHWMDSSTGAWFTAMTRNIATLPLAIVVTSRFADDGSSPEIEIAHDAVLTDIELLPIQGDEFTQQMARALLGSKLELDPQTLALVSGKAKGNPFFTEQLILHLYETGELEAVAGAPEEASGDEARRRKLRMKHSDTARLPGSLNSLVTARIDRLSPEVRETVKHASVLGARFLSRVLGELLERSGKVTRTMEDLLLESEQEGVILPASRGRGRAEA